MTALTLFDDSDLGDAEEFQNVIVFVQYLLIIQLDISFAVNKFAQYMQKSAHSNLAALKKDFQVLIRHD